MHKVSINPWQCDDSDNQCPYSLAGSFTDFWLSSSIHTQHVENYKRRAPTQERYYRLSLRSRNTPTNTLSQRMSKGLVLVTGANGFVGTAVTRSFADAGYLVRGTIRSQGKVKDWEKWNPEYKDKVECDFDFSALPSQDFALTTLPGVIVEDITAPNAFAEAIKGVKFVAHTASPFHCKCSLSSSVTTSIVLPIIHQIISLIMKRKCCSPLFAAQPP